ncbi:hypothetical protein JQC91_05040 [Jannaschia sp. Os4]|uniref:MotE family protein n=1 Tax=Jannaschia sp. Os4 TaxID=2807617 RepID=UPI0019399A9B|nr:hypothetical protein [Jannaschia sp. Os4]MBM2575664.1 hypothetical protein [Jannaschia sp. Os4]
MALCGLALATGAKLASVVPLPPQLAAPLASAVVGSLAMPARAADAEATPSDPGDAEPDTSSDARHTGNECTAPEAVLALIADERADLAEQVAALDVERAAIEALRLQVDADLAALSRMRDELQVLVDGVERRQSEDLERLVNLYRGMKPAQAAAIVADMDMGVTISILGAMAERDAAPILARLDPIRAGAISRVLLERGKLPADRDLSGLRLR